MDGQRKGQMDTEVVVVVWLGGQNRVWMDQCMRRCLNDELGHPTGLSSVESNPDTARTSSHIQHFGELIPPPDPQGPQALLGLSPNRRAAWGGDEQETGHAG